MNLVKICNQSCWNIQGENCEIGPESIHKELFLNALEAAVTLGGEWKPSYS